MKKRTSLGVNARLGLAFGLALLMLVGLAAMAEMQRRSLEAELRRFAQDEMARVRLVDRWVATSEATSLRIMAVNKANDPVINEFFGPEIEPAIREVGALFKEIEAAATDPQERQALEAFIPKREALHRALADMREFKSINDVAGASAMFDTAFMPAQLEYNAAIREYSELQGRLLQSKLAEVEAEGRRAQGVLFGVTAVLVLAGCAFAWRTTRHIKGSLDHAVRVARSVAGGDLSVRVASRNEDEFGQLMTALAHMTGSLDTIVREVRSGTDGITSASGEIARGHEDLSSRTEEQASRLQQTASAMAQLTSTVRHNAQTAQQANGLARQAVAVAERGGEAISSVTRTMGDIRQSSDRIEEIIGVIDGISFQTNILALNAAVEAARAGEQGRGFAVVAGEVRALAQRSAAAAKEIKTLIADSVDRVQAGARQVEAASMTMTEIVASVQQVGQLMSEISTATEQQTAGISDVNGAVASLDEMTQQNAALVEEASSAAESMRQQALALERSVSVFRLSAA